MYVVTGATGHTGSLIAKALLSRGKEVRVVSRNAERLKVFVDQGAEPFAANLSDAATLTRAFSGADAVYAMIPPDLASPDVRSFQDRVADAVASALQNARVPNVVTLSSVGADKAENTGPVVGLHHLEQKLNAIDNLNVLHLRAGYFMENTLAQVGIIRMAGMAVGPLRSDLKLPMIATRDIADRVTAALLNLDFRGKRTRELLGQRDLSMSEAAEIIGKAIGNPDLQYVQASNEQVRPALMKAGMSANMADLLLEMAASLNSGYMRALEPRSPQNTTPTSYEGFVNEELVPLYGAQSGAA